MASSGGGNKISYGLDRPEYEYSTSTTQFDDELMKRDVISFEQAMMAKGASAAEARRLADGRAYGDGGVGVGVGDAAGDIRNGKRTRAARRPSGSSDTDGEDDDGRSHDEEEDNNSDINGDDADDDDDGGAFLANYRRMRLRELQNGSRYGDVLHISRSDWTREVNEASIEGQWVLINLTRGSSTATVSARHVDACETVEGAASELARRFPRIKFVSIAASAANENWPPHNLPTLFCYRDGRLQHQLVGVEEFGGHGITTDRVEWRLAQAGVLETDLEEDPERGSYEVAQCDDADEYRTNSTAKGGTTKRQFGGVMSTWATRRDSDEEEDLSDID
mmetsp:Transcript_4879/g.13777  ORF Transcript_4879/g.13777 Transcript_4879/m.13777 type:complete len:335 (+) Transcript_4879:87-1091(+)